MALGHSGSLIELNDWLPEGPRLAKALAGYLVFRDLEKV